MAGRYNNTIVIGTGLKVTGGSPIDDRLMFDTLADFQAMLDDADAIHEAPTLYDGAEITLMYDLDFPTVKHQTKYLWKESAYGVLTIGYTYLAPYAIGGIIYKDKVFNLMPAADVATIRMTLPADTIEIQVPLGRLPYSAVKDNIFNVMMKEGSDPEYVLPDKVKLDLANNILKVSVYPAYPTDTVLTLKIS